VKRRRVPGAAASAAEPLDRRAYRAAGHHLMDYLLRHGRATKYLPMDRTRMLPERRHITINGEGTNWAEHTTATGSLLTVPQVLLAGYVAERRKFSPAEAAFGAPSPLVERARGLLRAYGEQYGSSDAPGGAESKAEDRLKALQPYIAKLVRKRWRAVTAVAEALMRQRTLELDEADELVRTGLMRSTLAGTVALGLERLGRLGRRRPARGRTKK
jgi:hypothetical protein